MKKVYALLSKQGTACSETALFEDEYTEQNKKRIEKLYCNGQGDSPIKETWTDVSDNDAINLSFNNEL